MTWSAHVKQAGAARLTTANRAARVFSHIFGGRPRVRPACLGIHIFGRPSEVRPAYLTRTIFLEAEKPFASSLTRYTPEGAGFPRRPVPFQVTLFSPASK